MIFVPSYFDYVRLRKFLREQEVEFEGLSEYASGSEVARGRARFSAGKTRIALYTERAYFYHRRRTKGVKVRSGVFMSPIMAYGLPGCFSGEADDLSVPVKELLQSMIFGFT